MDPGLRGSAFLTASSEAEALALVQEVFREATPIQKESIIRAYVGVTTRQYKRFKPARRKTQSGGHDTYTGPAEIYHLFEAAEILHDFRHSPAAVAEAQKVALPNGWDLETLCSETAFLNAVAKPRILAFQDQAIHNPMHGLSIPDAAIDIDALTRGLDTMDGVHRRLMSMLGSSPPLASAGVLTEHRAKPKAVELQEVAYMMARLHQEFGSSGSFLVESNVAGNLILEICFGIHNIDRALFRAFTANPPCIDWTDVSAKLRQFVETELGHAEPPAWKVVACDANIFDAGDVAYGSMYRAEPTGNIFPAMCPFQVHLDGIDLRHNTTNATIHDNAGTQLAIQVNRRNAHALSKTAIMDMMAGRVLASENKTYHKIRTLPVPTLLALKRAGDWGQAEHCARYGTILMTQDRLAAAYAMLRGVGCVCLSIRLGSIEESDGPPTEFEVLSLVMRRRMLRQPARTSPTAPSSQGPD